MVLAAAHDLHPTLVQLLRPCRASPFRIAIIRCALLAVASQLERQKGEGGKGQLRDAPRPVPSRDAPVDDGSEPVAPSGWSEGRHHQRSPVMLMQLGSGEKILDESIGNMRLKILDFNLR